MTDIAANLAVIKQRIAAAVTAAGRDPASVQLVAVSKGHPAEAVQAALAAGQICFGENRVQEAVQKFAPLRAAHPSLKLHLIGPLQTNKAASAVELFDVIETLDRPALAEILAAEMRKQNRNLPCLIEVNIGREPQKAGIMPQELGGFLELCRATHHLIVEGLMCIPPQGDDSAAHFTRLRALARAHGLPRLSMGMSGDFEAAIACGATSVRVGSALFGERAVSKGLLVPGS